MRLCAASARTARRWRARGLMPAKLAAWVAVHQGGDLGALDAAWRGWRLKDGQLFGPDHVHGFAPGAVQGIPYQRLLIDHYQREQRFAARAAAELEDANDSQESSSTLTDTGSFRLLAGS